MIFRRASLGKPKERSASLIEDTLSADGFVEISLERDGIAETWRRELGNCEKIAVTDVVGTTSQMTLADAQQKFPARPLIKRVFPRQ